MYANDENGTTVYGTERNERNEHTVLNVINVTRIRYVLRVLRVISLRYVTLRSGSADYA